MAIALSARGYAQTMLPQKKLQEHKTKEVASYSLVIMEIIGAALKKWANSFNNMCLEQYDSMKSYAPRLPLAPPGKASPSTVQTGQD